ncbi:hypothetical protein JCM6882_003115 [Rhodosporidiobolus microsporus]
MSTTDEPGECAVCAATTSSRCSACKVNLKFFCSREHQKLLWPTHKWLCDKDPSILVLPPFTDSELAAIEGFYAAYKAGRAREDARVLFESLEEAGLEDPLGYIKGINIYPNPDVREPLRSYTLLELYLLLAPSLPNLPTSTPGSPWITCSAFLDQLKSRLPPAFPAHTATMLFHHLAPVDLAMVDFATCLNRTPPSGTYLSAAFRRLKATARAVRVDDPSKAAVMAAVELWKQVTQAVCALPQHEGTLRFDV